MNRRGWLLPLMLVAACTKNIDEGQQIKEIVASEEETTPVPVAKTERIGPSANLALENYEKLLDLPQDPVTRAETMRRLADLQLEIDEAGGATLEQSDQRLRRSIALYNAVLTDRPDAPGNDRVLYQLARAYQNVGEIAKAEEVLLRMTRDYPQSPYADDAHFRRAELLFRLEQFDDASAEYRRVLALKEATPFFEAAQYKYGWSEYRQSKYETALMVFLTILGRELPPGELTDVKAALDGVAQGKKDMAQDALRVVSLSLTRLGGSDAANRYFAANGEPPYGALIYSALGDHLLEKKRYTDASKTYESFVNAHPRHDLAPSFLARAIAAQDLGGFIEPVVQAKERYARHFDPAAPYWAGRSPTPEVLKSLRAHLEDLGRYYQARGQKPRDAALPPAKTDFQAAARWYQRLLEIYPQDPQAAELRFLMAESLFEAGATTAAAQEYSKVVADHPNYEKAPDAAYAALLAHQRFSKEAPEAQRPAALRQSVQAGLQLAERYPQHPQALAALTRAAEDLYLLHAWDEAVQVAERVLKAAPPAPDALLRTAWSVTADAHFSQKRFAQAETAYAELLKLTPAESAERATLSERLASSIYKQGEAARDAGDAKTAAEAFLRVGRSVPGASIRAAADFDAGTMLILLKDWTQAGAVLEAFRAAHGASPLLPDIDKKLAVVYESAGKLKEAAVVLHRIAARATETAENRRDAAWLAVTLLDQARDPRAAAEYDAYVKQYPQPLERAIEARQKLADFSAARGEDGKRLYWLREIIAADSGAGSARTPRSRQLAAQATLELGRADAQKAAKVPLKLPLKQSLPAKKEAMERAIATLSQAADYGVAEVTTAATFELGVLYQGLSKSLLESDRPKKLSTLEREQYDLLLEEQAFPFEEKAIQWHEANLQRVTQGVYNRWIGRSLQSLTQIAPGRYGKREQTAEVYDLPLPDGAVPSTAPSAKIAPAKAPPARAPAPRQQKSGQPKTVASGTVAGKPQAKPVPGKVEGPASPAHDPGPAAAGATEPPPAPRTPRERYAEAVRLLMAKQWQPAEAALLVSARDYPQLTGPQTNLGIVYARTSRKPEAVAAFTRAINLDPSNAIAYNWLAVLAREAGDLRRAEQAYRQALAADAAHAPAQLNLAILYDQHLKRPAEALTAYRRYEELTGKKDLRAAVWIAELEAQLPAAPAAKPAGPLPGKPVPAPAPAAPAPPRKAGAKS